MQMEFIRKMPQPQELLREYPLDSGLKRLKAERDREIADILTGRDDRLLQYHKTAIFFSAVILIVTVSSMLIAVHPAIRSVGFSTLIGLLSAVILSYVVQPAVYRWLKNKKA